MVFVKERAKHRMQTFIQKNLNPRRSMNPKIAHTTGVTYSAVQKTNESVEPICFLDSGSSLLSKTHFS